MRLKTIMALCMVSMALFAQKAPKGKFLSYSHTSSNPEIPVNDEFCLSWDNGKGTLTIRNRFMTSEYEYSAEVSEEVFQQVADSIKEKKLYVASKKKKGKKDPELIPNNDPGREEYSIIYKGKAISHDSGNLNEEQEKAFHELEEFIKDVVKGIQPPTGELVECGWSSESTVPGRGGEYGCLSIHEGQDPVLTIGESSSTPGGNKEKKYIVTAEDVQILNELIIKEKVYKIDGYNGEDMSGMSPMKRVYLKYDNGVIYQARWTHQAPPYEVVKAAETILGFCQSLPKTLAGLPEGKMIYCSCAYTNYGLPVGEIQYSYYELIADEGTTPKVVFCENRGDSEKTEYQATEQNVIELSNLLRDMNVFKINGYNVDERMTGGTSYRIHMEFSSGEKLNANWFTHKPEPLAIDVYNTILRYLSSVTESQVLP